METVNFEVIEYHLMTCPFCCAQQDAPFNHANPMQPMKVSCEICGEEFMLTYERE